MINLTLKENINIENEMNSKSEEEFNKLRFTYK